VKQKESLQYCESNLNKKKYELTVIENQSLLLKQHKIELKKEDSQLLQEALQTSVRLVSQNSLQQTMQVVSEGAEKNQESFANKISQQLVPSLNKTINELAGQLQSQKYLEVASGFSRIIKELQEMHEQVLQLEEDAKK